MNWENKARQPCQGYVLHAEGEGRHCWAYADLRQLPARQAQQAARQVSSRKVRCACQGAGATGNSARAGDADGGADAWDVYKIARLDALTA